MELKSTRARRRAYEMVVALAVAVMGATCGTGNAQEPEAQAREAVAVRIVPVEQQRVARPILATGVFGPKDEIVLSFTIGGVVAAVDVDAGATVRAGQRLASLQLREIDATLAKARSAAAKAERDLERVRRLFTDSVATLSQLQDAETAYDVAQADLQGAAFNRRYAVIEAPADGVVLRRAAEPGETVGPGSPILVVGSRDRGAVLRVGLPDRDVLRIRRGDTAVARFDAIPGRTFRGAITEIGAAAALGTGTYEVEVSIHDAEALVAGLVGRVEIFPSEGTVTAVVPVEAILEADGDQAVVYTLSADGRRAERRTVTVTLLDGGLVAVSDGLQGVQSVVTDGAAWLSDRDAVRVIR